MDGVSDLLTWSEDNDVDLEFFLDPEYDEFENDLFEKKGELMTIMVRFYQFNVNVWVCTDSLFLCRLDSSPVLVQEVPKYIRC